MVCGSCRGWLYTSKLRKAKGWCSCGQWLGDEIGWGKTPPPWWGPTPSEARDGLDGEQAALAYLAKHTCYGGKIEELVKREKEAAAKAEPPPPPKSAWQQLQSAQGQFTHKQELLQQAQWDLEQAEAARDAAERCREEALEAAWAAQKQLEAAKQLYYNGKRSVDATGDTAEEGQSVLTFECAEELQGDLDEYEDGPIKDEILKFRETLRTVQQQGRDALQQRQAAIDAAAAAAEEAAKAHKETDARLRAQAEAHQKLLLENAEKVRNRLPSLKKKRRVGDDGAARPGAEAGAPAAKEECTEGPASGSQEAGPSEEEIAKRKAELDELRERTAQECKERARGAAGAGSATAGKAAAGKAKGGRPRG